MVRILHMTRSRYMASRAWKRSISGKDESSERSLAIYNIILVLIIYVMQFIYLSANLNYCIFFLLEYAVQLPVR